MFHRKYGLLPGKGTATEESWDEAAFKLSCLGRAGEIKVAENFPRFGKKKKPYFCLKHVKNSKNTGQRMTTAI